MFQAEPVIWLQSFESSTMNVIMTCVSWLGYSIFYSILVMVLACGYRARPTFCILTAILLCGLLTLGGKNGLKYPRPSDIDSRIVEPGSAEPVHLTDRGAATSFFSLIPEPTLEKVRAQPEWSYGVPSGHVSLATTFFLGCALFFHSQIMLAFSLVWIPLMALSRMYLGLHFLADVLAGILVGCVALALAYFLTSGLLREEEAESDEGLRLPRYLLKNWALAVTVCTLTVLVPFVPIVDPELVGRLAAILVVCYLFHSEFLVFDDGNFVQRSLRVVVVVIAYFGTSWLVATLVALTPFEDHAVAMFFTTFTVFLSTFALLLGSCKLLKLNSSSTSTVA